VARAAGLPTLRRIETMARAVARVLGRRAQGARRGGSDPSLGLTSSSSRRIAARLFDRPCSRSADDSSMLFMPTGAPSSFALFFGGHKQGVARRRRALADEQPAFRDRSAEIGSVTRVDDRTQKSDRSYSCLRSPSESASRRMTWRELQREDRAEPLELGRDAGACRPRSAGRWPRPTRRARAAA